jgi:hypothetical protein
MLWLAWCQGPLQPALILPAKEKGRGGAKGCSFDLWLFDLWLLYTNSGLACYLLMLYGITWLFTAVLAGRRGIQ